jgi:hypothetical protein
MSPVEATLLPSKAKDFIFSLAGKKLADHIEDLIGGFDILPDSISDLWKKAYPPKATSLRRLVFFPDKEGKTRTIALFDYWSQSALKGLHRNLNRILSSLRCDCTFNQNKFIELLKDKPVFHSLDLKSATDRMPIIFQKIIISHIIGPVKALA